MYYSAIGTIAILILFIVNWDILRDSRINDNAAWNVYRRFLFAVLAYYITDVLWGILEARKLAFLLFVDTTVYFAAMAVGLSFWAEYTVAYLKETGRFGRFLIIAGRVIAGAILGMALVNIFKPVLFSVDKYSVYKAFPARYVLLICQILFLLIISMHSLSVMFRRGIRSENSVRFRILASFGIIMALFLFIQLWFPYLPLYSIAYMLGTCLLHAFVINDEKDSYRKELKKAKEIGELKERFQSVLDNIPAMTFTKDAKTGEYLTCNKAFVEYVRKDSPEEVCGLTDLQLFDAESAARFQEDDKTALSLSRPYVFYDEIPDERGENRRLQKTKLKYVDSTGRLCVLGICQDITDLVNVQRENDMTKEAYETAVNTGLIYNRMAQMLARDYTKLFYVNSDSEEFTEYGRETENSPLLEIRRGWHFFSDIKKELSEDCYPDDKEAFLQALNRKNLMNALSCRHTFVMTYRRLIGDEPVEMNMKITRTEGDEHFIIIGFGFSLTGQF